MIDVVVGGKRGPAAPVVFGAEEPMLPIIAGPCQLENMPLAMKIAEALVRLSERGHPVVFKASWDKANRSHAEAKRGVSITDALQIFYEVGRLGLPVTTDVHEAWQCKDFAGVVDLLQIPALLCRQTDLIIAAGKTGLPVNIKKGQFASAGNMLLAAEKVGHDDVILTERGTFLGYGDLVVDMRNLSLMGAHYPVVFDATHSVQTSRGDYTGGRREFVDPLARAAVAVGVSGVFIETHPDPMSSPSDAQSMVKLETLPALVEQLAEIHALRRRQIAAANPGEGIGE